jgi:glycosyltransferase involved in cell wall biosynthesis
MRTRRRILFVSHAATRNGATILLLNLLRWLKCHTDDQLELLVCGTGELIREFEAIGPTTIWRNPDKVFGLLSQSALRTRLESQLLKWQMRGRSYDLVYLNTAAVACYAGALARLAGSVLWHIHELGYALRNAISTEGIGQVLPVATRFLAVSDSVRKMLVQEFKVAPDKVDLVHEFIPTPNVSTEQAEFRRRQIRQELDWPEDAFVVGGCGALGWRKGTDIFLQVAQAMSGLTGQDRTRFLWVGGGSKDEVLRFRHDSHMFGLGQRCRHIPATPAVMDYYGAMDVFALTSREDPFPLVMLEAAASNLPLVCFEGAGGAPEFVGHDAGLIAPYLGIQAFASHVDTLRESPELRFKLGAAAARKVRESYVVEKQGPKVLDSITSCLRVGPNMISIP